MEVLVRIEFKDEEVLASMLNGKRAKLGANIAASEEWSVNIKQLVKYRAGGFNQALELTISFFSGVGASLLASWLYGKLKGKNARLTIDHMEVEIDRDKIKAKFTKMRS